MACAVLEVGSHIVEFTRGLWVKRGLKEVKLLMLYSAFTVAHSFLPVL